MSTSLEVVYMPHSGSVSVELYVMLGFGGKVFNWLRKFLIFYNRCYLVKCISLI